MYSKPLDVRVGADGMWRDIVADPAVFGGRPVLFLDRDGVIVEDVNYLHRVQDIRFVAGIAPLIARARSSGAAIVVTTNQSGVGRGLFGWPEFAAVEDEIARRLSTEGAAVDAVFACPFHADARPPYRHSDHPARKPNPGMIEMAAQLFGADLSRSWIVGDRVSDLMAARHGGLAGGFLLGHGHAAGDMDRALALGADRFVVHSIDHLDQVDGHVDWLKGSA